MSVPTPTEMFTDVTYKRYATGGYVDGAWVEGSESQDTFKGSVQPAKASELLNFPEAQRTRGAVKVYSNTLLRTADERSAIQADRVVWDGEDWEVQQIFHHPLSNLAHYKSIAFRLNRA